MNLEFANGAEFNHTGLVVETVLINGEATAVTGFNVDSSAFHSQVPGSHIIVVSFAGLQAQYIVTVLPKAGGQNISPIGLVISGEFVNHAINQPLTWTGVTVSLLFSDNTTVLLTRAQLSISGFDNTTAGTRQVTISAFGQSTTVDVQVSETATRRDFIITVDGTAQTIREFTPFDPGTPSRQGFDFLGWVYDNDDFENDILRGDEFVIGTLVTHAFAIVPSWRLSTPNVVISTQVLSDGNVQMTAHLLNQAAAASNITYTYQWQFSTNGIDFVNEAGATSATFVAGKVGTFRVAVTATYTDPITQATQTAVGLMTQPVLDISFTVWFDSISRRADQSGFVSVPTAPARAGYRFVRWVHEGTDTEFNPSVPVTSGYRIRSVWILADPAAEITTRTTTAGSVMITVVVTEFISAYTYTFEWRDGNGALITDGIVTSGRESVLTLSVSATVTLNIVVSSGSETANWTNNFGAISIDPTIDFIEFNTTVGTTLEYKVGDVFNRAGFNARLNFVGGTFRIALASELEFVFNDQVLESGFTFNTAGTFTITVRFVMFNVTTGQFETIDFDEFDVTVSLIGISDLTFVFGTTNLTITEGGAFNFSQIRAIATFEDGTISHLIENRHLEFDVPPSTMGRHRVDVRYVCIYSGAVGTGHFYVTVRGLVSLEVTSSRRVFVSLAEFNTLVGSAATNPLTVTQVFNDHTTAITTAYTHTVGALVDGEFVVTVSYSGFVASITLYISTPQLFVVGLEVSNITTFTQLGTSFASLIGTGGILVREVLSNNSTRNAASFAMTLNDVAVTSPAAAPALVVGNNYLRITTPNFSGYSLISIFVYDPAEIADPVVVALLARLSGGNIVDINGLDAEAVEAAIRSRLIVERVMSDGTIHTLSATTGFSIIGISGSLTSVGFANIEIAFVDDSIDTKDDAEITVVLNVVLTDSTILAPVASAIRAEGQQTVFNLSDGGFSTSGMRVYVVYADNVEDGPITNFNVSIAPAWGIGPIVVTVTAVINGVTLNTQFSIVVLDDRVLPKAPISISVAGQDSVLQGTAVNFNTFVVTVHYDDGSSQTTTAFTFTPSFNPNAVGRQMVRFTLQGHPTITADFFITVIGSAVQNIQVTDVEMVADEPISLAELLQDITITANTSDGRQVDVSDSFTVRLNGAVVAAANLATTMLEIGANVITIGAAGQQTTFIVVVKDDTIEPADREIISIFAAIDSTIFAEGDTFDTASITVTIVFDNGDTQVIADGFSISGLTPAQFDDGKFVSGGNIVLTITHDDHANIYTTINIFVTPTPTVVSIVVEGGRREFEIGDQFNIVGTAVIAVLSNGDRRVLDANEFDFTVTNVQTNVALTALDLASLPTGTFRVDFVSVANPLFTARYIVYVDDTTVYEPDPMAVVITGPIAHQAGQDINVVALFTVQLIMSDGSTLTVFHQSIAQNNTDFRFYFTYQIFGVDTDLDPEDIDELTVQTLNDARPHIEFFIHDKNADTDHEFEKEIEIILYEPSTAVVLALIVTPSQTVFDLSLGEDSFDPSTVHVQVRLSDNRVLNAVEENLTINASAFRAEVGSYRIEVTYRWGGRVEDFSFVVHVIESGIVGIRVASSRAYVDQAANRADFDFDSLTQGLIVELLFASGADPEQITDGFSVDFSAFNPLIPVAQRVFVTYNEFTAHFDVMVMPLNPLMRPIGLSIDSSNVAVHRIGSPLNVNAIRVFLILSNGSTEEYVQLSRTEYLISHAFNPNTEGRQEVRVNAFGFNASFWVQVSSAVENRWFTVMFDNNTQDVIPYSNFNIPTPSRVGFVFSHWVHAHDGSIVDVTAPISGNYVIRSVWEAARPVIILSSNILRSGEVELSVRLANRSLEIFYVFVWEVWTGNGWEIIEGETSSSLIISTTSRIRVTVRAALSSAEMNAGKFAYETEDGEFLVGDVGFTVLVDGVEQFVRRGDLVNLGVQAPVPVGYQAEWIYVFGGSGVFDPTTPVHSSFAITRRLIIATPYVLISATPERGSQRLVASILGGLAPDHNVAWQWQRLVDGEWQDIAGAIENNILASEDGIYRAIATVTNGEDGFATNRDSDSASFLNGFEVTMPSGLDNWWMWIAIGFGASMIPLAIVIAITVKKRKSA